MYARMVTSFVKPGKFDDMNDLYQNTLLPLIRRQAGFKGMFVLNNCQEYKEVSITLWDRLVDMEAFNVNLLALKDDITAFLTRVPEVEIFEVVVPEDAKPVGFVPLSETSLGIRIENPFG